MLIDRFGALVCGKFMLGFVLSWGDAVELTGDESYETEVIDCCATREWYKLILAPAILF